ncbi:hypothetical protein EDD18DRAFT_1106466 [Armillaria luteobubalina]|uniref:Uncharacterized protein n=1 Tax=Armillaria luteobubalina TaxID=153913 RepID=A0AA39Q2V1_9AGAR|nr:hypothetical protein EDD18DRAFT_1106466 [Armillaria luteobubalina]
MNSMRNTKSLAIWSSVELVTASQADTTLTLSHKRTSSAHVENPFKPDLTLSTTVHNIMGMARTKEGIEALALFLDKSGAFTKTGNPKQPPMHHTFEEEECILEDWLGNHNSVE